MRLKQVKEYGVKYKCAFSGKTCWFTTLHAAAYEDASPLIKGKFTLKEARQIIKNYSKLHNIQLVKYEVN